MHADLLPLSRRAGGNINMAGVQTFLTDTTVAAADTLNGLDAAVDAVVVHADRIPFKSYVKQAWRVDGGITDATVLSLTTVAGLTALTALGSDTTTQALFTDN